MSASEVVRCLMRLERLCHRLPHMVLNRKKRDELQQHVQVSAFIKSQEEKVILPERRASSSSSEREAWERGREGERERDLFLDLCVCAGGGGAKPVGRRRYDKITGYYTHRNHTSINVLAYWWFSRLRRLSLQGD